MACFARLTRRAPLANIPIERCGATVPEKSLDILNLHIALDKLAADAPEMVKVLDLFYFGGLTIDELAAQLEIDPRKAKFLRCKAIQILQLRLYHVRTQSHHH